MAKKLAFDRALFVTILVLVTLGLVMVYSAGSAVTRAQGVAENTYLVRQLLWVLLGFAALGGCLLFDYRRLASRWWVYGLLLATVMLLLAALLAPPVNGTHRWILVGPISVQPSELAKPVLMLVLAWQIALHGERLRDELGPKVPALGAVGLLFLLIAVEPDLGTACVLAGSAALILFVAGLRWRWFLLPAAGAIGAMWLGIGVAAYQRQRLLTFLHPEGDPLGAGFQTIQSLIAVGSGGLVGRGLGQSLQKLYFVPYPHTDFIFAILAEELGLLGCLAVVALFGVLLWRGVRAGLQAPDAFGRHLAWGLTAIIVLQALINMSVVTALLPTKGIPLPFISYGGSSMVVTLASCGLILNVSQHG